jgi:hypothetical protein
LAVALALSLPAARASSAWSVDETITIRDASTEIREWRVHYDPTVYAPRWTLAMPDGATFQGAHGAAGEPLPATASGGNVTITSDGDTFFADFQQPLVPDGAFLAAPAGPSAGADSPTSVRYQLAAGWTMAGWDATPGLPAPVNGSWGGTGPFYVEALLLPPGVPDPGPDARLSGTSAVARFAQADVGEAGSLLNVTLVYDTDTYAPTWTIPVPAGTRVLGVTAPLPNLTERMDGQGNLVVQAPYPASHHLGARSFTVEEAVALDAFGGGYLRANLSVPASPGDALSLTLHLADGLDGVGARLSGRVVPLQENYSASGAATLQLAYLAPPPFGDVRFQEGPFVVQAPAAQQDAARDAARQAAVALPDAASFASDRLGDAPLHVLYTDRPVFSWEEGVYQGFDAISIRASDLGANGTANLTAVRTLVHEATHALVDRRLAGAQLPGSFLNEGLSRLAEVHVELQHPDLVLRCTAAGLSRLCSRDSARVDAAALQAFLRSGAAFDVGWDAANASDDQRGFLYDYSGFVLLHYERVAPPGALGRALDRLAAGSADPESVVQALLAESPGLARGELLYPGRADAGLPADAFAARMGDLVAPPFPTSSTAAGLHVPDVGAAAAALGAAGATLLLRRRRA